MLNPKKYTTHIFDCYTLYPLLCLLYICYDLCRWIVFLIIVAELQEKGVSCFYHNIRIVNTCHVIFLCVLPSQVQLVANEIKEYLRPDCVIYSFLPSVSLCRLKQLFCHISVIHPEFIWPKDNNNTTWDNSLDMSAILMNQSLVRQTCPLYMNKDGRYLLMLL